MADHEQDQIRRVCAWCSDAIDAGEHYELVMQEPTGRKSTYLCSNKCLNKWVDCEHVW